MFNIQYVGMELRMPKLVPIDKMEQAKYMGLLEYLKLHDINKQIREEIIASDILSFIQHKSLKLHAIRSILFLVDLAPK